MSIVLVRRWRGLHALLEMALRDERARPRPDDRTVASIKKKKLALKDRLAVPDGPQVPCPFNSRPIGSAPAPPPPLVPSPKRYVSSDIRRSDT